MTAIRTINLRKLFGSFVAVRDVSFDVAEGENFGLLGPNGAGKSTLIRFLTTLLLPTSGSALIAGYDVRTHADDVRKHIGVIPQAMTSDPDLTAVENLHFQAKLYAVRRRERLALAESLLAEVGLLDFRNALVRTFSGGMRRRLEIARSLMHRPRILFLDEPTSGLDPTSRTAMWDMLRRLKTQTGLTVFLTTHYMEEADQLCDRLAIVDHGRLIALDTPERLKALVPGTEAIEVAFAACPPSWLDRLRALPGVQEVDNGHTSCRIESTDRIATVRALLEMAGRYDVKISALAVKGRTLDDVFLNYTGRDLRDTTDPKARRSYAHLYEHRAGR